MISVDLWKVSEELNKLEVHVIGGIAYVAVDDVMEILKRNTGECNKVKEKRESTIYADYIPLEVYVGNHCEFLAKEGQKILERNRNTFKGGQG